MNLFNSIVIRTVSYLPKSLAKPFAKPYVAGETIEEALSNVKILNQKGFCATLDILGEHVKSKTFAKNIRETHPNPPTSKSRRVLGSSLALLGSSQNP